MSQGYERNWMEDGREEGHVPSLPMDPGECGQGNKDRRLSAMIRVTTVLERWKATATFMEKLGHRHKQSGVYSKSACNPILLVAHARSRTIHVKSPVPATTHLFKKGLIRRKKQTRLFSHGPTRISSSLALRLSRPWH